MAEEGGSDSSQQDLVLGKRLLIILEICIIITGIPGHPAGMHLGKDSGTRTV